MRVTLPTEASQPKLLGTLDNLYHDLSVTLKGQSVTLKSQFLE